jgi:hypothetical protein
MTRVDIAWLEPWAPIERPDEQKAIQAELYVELCPAHQLHGASIVALARRVDQDDILVGLTDGRVAEVHLTWSRKPERGPCWPRTIVFASAADWSEARMRPLNEEFRASAPLD